MGQVSNLVLRNVEARRFIKLSPTPVQVRIDNNLAVTTIRAEGTNGAHVEFNYTAVFGALGVIKIEGEFVYSGDLAIRALREWDEKKTMPGDAASEIHTTIMHACLPEAVTLAKTVHLPPPIPMPVVKFEKKDGAAQARIGGPSPEVT